MEGPARSRVGQRAGSSPFPDRIGCNPILSARYPERNRDELASGPPRRGPPAPGTSATRWRGPLPPESRGDRVGVGPAAGLQGMPGRPSATPRSELIPFLGDDAINIPVRPERVEGWAWHYTAPSNRLGIRTQATSETMDERTSQALEKDRSIDITTAQTRAPRYGSTTWMGSCIPRLHQEPETGRQRGAHLPP